MWGDKGHGIAWNQQTAGETSFSYWPYTVLNHHPARTTYTTCNMYETATETQTPTTAHFHLLTTTTAYTERTYTPPQEISKSEQEWHLRQCKKKPSRQAAYRSPPPSPCPLPQPSISRKYFGFCFICWFRGIKPGCHSPVPSVRLGYRMGQPRQPCLFLQLFVSSARGRHQLFCLWMLRFSQHSLPYNYNGVTQHINTVYFGHS